MEQTNLNGGIVNRLFDITIPLFIALSIALITSVIGFGFWWVFLTVIFCAFIAVLDS